MSKRYLFTLKYPDETLILDQAETHIVLTAAQQKGLAIIPSYKGGFQTTRIVNFQEVVKKTCEKCGETYESQDQHYCSPQSIKDLAKQESGDPAADAAAEKLGRQMKLILQGVPAKQAYEQAFGEPWEPPRNQAQLEDVANGKGFFKDGQFFYLDATSRIE